MRSRLVFCLVATTGILTGVTPITANAAGSGCVHPQGVYAKGTPWAQNLIDAARIWPLSTGSGVTVAVLGTGVDADNAQFAPGAVKPMISSTGGIDGAADCAGFGTFAAGIVAAQPNSSTTFAGIAPGAHILPVRFTDTGPGNDQGADPVALASAITSAVGAHASVILVAVPATSDDPALRAAVHAANQAGDVVVAPAIGGQSGSVSYPAGDPGAISVAALNQSGGAVKAESGAIAAPGADLVGLAANGGGAVGQVWSLQDPSFASAAYVAGVVALMRAYPPLSGSSPEQIANRLTATASKPAGNGAGIVNAYAAVTAELPAQNGKSVASNRPVQPAAAANASGPADRIAGLFAVLGVLLAGVIVVAARSIRRAKSRGWRVGRIS
ncbi:MAG TPA: S8 family serine peptidase [Pseudonocardiaceae bacterium]|nr:S8 family serine peptidase [Pseudonocardiaceae bacterium]